MKICENIRVSKKWYIAAILFIAYSFLLVHIVQAFTNGSAEPGTDANPLVAQDYVDSRVYSLNQQLQELRQTQASMVSPLFQVLELRAGQQLVAGASAEIIVRSGIAAAVSGEKGDGLSNITIDDSAQGNLVTGQVVPLNHLLLVSRDDGRGIKAVSDRVFILFKGTYTIK